MTARYLDRRGFALIVVLAALSIIALLFAMASDRAITRLAGTRTDMLLAQSAFDSRSALALAVKAYGAGDAALPTDSDLMVIWNGRAGTLRLQDVGGLVDLNTAAPELLEQLSAAIGVAPEGIEAYRRWRRMPHRLLRVSDYLRLSGGEPEASDVLRRFATVHSGRRGIAPESAPPGLIALIGVGETADLPSDWVTPPSNANFNVVLNIEGETPRILGTINLAGLRNSQILQAF